MNLSWIFVGNLVYAASQWGTLTVLVKLGTPAMVGQFALGLAITAPVLAISMLQLRAVQVTDVRGEFGFGHYFGARLVTSTAAFVVVVGIAYLAHFDAQTAYVICLIGLAKCIDSVSEIVRGLFQRHECMHLSGSSLLIKGPSALVAFGFLLWLTNDLLLPTLGMAFVWMLALLLFDLPHARSLLTRLRGAKTDRLAPIFDPRPLMRLGRRALPLGIVMLLGAFQNNVPRYVLQGWYGNASLGYFAALVYPMVVGTMVVTALGQSASPRLASYFVDNLGQYCRLLKKLLLLSLALGFLLVAGVVFAGEVALRWLYSPDYARYQPEFVVLSFGAAITLTTSFCGYGLTAARAFRIQSVLAGVTCAAAIGAALYLVPPYHVRGAAVTVLVTAIVMFLCFAIALWGVVKRRKQELEAKAQDDGTLVGYA